MEPIGKNGAGGGTRTLTHSRAADFESAASAISPPRLKHFNIIPKNRSNSKSYRIIFFGALQLRFIGIFFILQLNRRLD